MSAMRRERLSRLGIQPRRTIDEVRAIWKQISGEDISRQMMWHFLNIAENKLRAELADVAQEYFGD